jgi:hypothetical protein
MRLPVRIFVVSNCDGFWLQTKNRSAPMRYPSAESRNKEARPPYFRVRETLAIREAGARRGRAHREAFRIT